MPTALLLQCCLATHVVMLPRTGGTAWHGIAVHCICLMCTTFVGVDVGGNTANEVSRYIMSTASFLSAFSFLGLVFYSMLSTRSSSLASDLFDLKLQVLDQ